MGLKLTTLFDLIYWLVWLVTHALAAAAGLAVAQALWGPSVLQQGAALAVASGALTSGLGYAVWYAALPSSPNE